jgi:predicted aspartyl protease
VQAKRGVAWLTVLGRILVCATLFAQAGDPRDCPRKANSCAPSDGRRTSLRFEICRDFLIVAEAEIGDSHTRERRAFILDTGTAPSIVDERVAKDLGLAASASTATVLGKTVESEMATLPQLELGAIRVADMRVEIQDLSRVERDLGLRLGGILGLDVLATTSFRIDYERRQIEFGDISDDGIAVDVDPGSSLAVARVILRSKPVRMLVDTGTDQVVLLRENFTGAEWFAVARTSQQGATVRGHAEPMEVLLDPELVVGGRLFRVSRAYFVPGASDPAFDGLLGVRALGFRAIAYNRARRRIYLQK